MRQRLAVKAAMNPRYLNISEVREIMQSDQRKFDEMVHELKSKERRNLSGRDGGGGADISKATSPHRHSSR
jgi:hypothetical protein